MGEIATLMKNRPLAQAALMALVALCTACTDQTKVHEGEMTQLLALLPGRYENSTQAEIDARSGGRPGHEVVALVITHVNTPRLGHHVFYAQEMAVDDLAQAIMQRWIGEGHQRSTAEQIEMLGAGDRGRQTGEVLKVAKHGGCVFVARNQGCEHSV